MGIDPGSELGAWADERGFALAWGPVEVVVRALGGVESLRSAGEIDEGFYEEWLKGYERISRDDFPPGSSVIMVAVPRPVSVLTFEAETGPFEVLVPPTYVGNLRLQEEIRSEIAAEVLPGASVRIIVLPKKAAAVQLGLARYGRNNVSYIEDLGSYFQLVGLLADVNLGNAGWKPRKHDVLAACSTCSACSDACPTGAIGERFLIHAEDCLTRYSELPIPLPPDLPLGTGGCLLGCMICQEVCPYNRDMLRSEKVLPGFTMEETLALLEGESGIEDMPSLQEKLQRLGLKEYGSVLGRNLDLLMAREPGTLW